MRKRREYLALEKQLLNKRKETEENEILLENADFKDGKLSWTGYSRLKDECEYVDYAEYIEIKIPSDYIEGFNSCLEAMATNELSKIKKDKREARIKALILYLIGIVVLTIGLLVIEHIVRQEFMLILSWVFIWAGSEKLFFDRKDLQNRRYNLLHILSAKVTIY